MSRTSLRIGANVNETNSQRSTALHYLVRGNWSPELQKLLDNFILKLGANVDAKNTFDETPLHSAVTRGKQDSVKYLLKHSVDVNATNKYHTRSRIATFAHDVGLEAHLLKRR